MKKCGTLTQSYFSDVDALALLNELIEVANARYDGHLTIMKFTTNWHVGFVTPSRGMLDEASGTFRNVPELLQGETFLSAGSHALQWARTDVLRRDAA